LPKKTFELARDAEVTLITQVKDNQEELRKQLTHGTKIQKPVDRFESEVECAHGRIEHRLYEVFDAEKCLKKFPEWKEIRQMIRVRRMREIKGGKATHEEVLYASNTALSALDYAKYIRNHWLIENELNHVKDVSFLEDSSKRRVNPVIFSTCISFALNIIRKHFAFYDKSHKSVRGILYENSLSIEKTLELIPC
jgi:predicted transposase YbfD/YdcC